MRNIDDIDPRYCRYCRLKKKRTELNSTGYCEDCQQLVDEEELKKEKYRNNTESKLEPDKETMDHIDTGRGYCHQCKSRNIREFENESGGFDARAPACCCGCLFLFPPLLLLFPFLKGNTVKTTHRVCRTCGNRWQV